jgi:TM2 domain-containing membrane protein YozV
MSEVSQGLGWWQASDGKWYAPELHPDHQAPTLVDQPTVSSSAIGSDQVFLAADSAPALSASGSDQVFLAADSAPVFAAADSAPVLPAADSAAPAFPAAAPDPVFAVANQSGPVAYPNIQYPDVPASGDKSKTTAGLLAIFLGALGIHRFYMGYKLIGAIMLIITVASVGRLAPITVLWGLAEGILIFTGKMKKDKYGGELT